MADTPSRGCPCISTAVLSWRGPVDTLTSARRLTRLMRQWQRTAAEARLCPPAHSKDHPAPQPPQPRTEAPVRRCTRGRQATKSASRACCSSPCEVQPAHRSRRRCLPQVVRTTMVRRQSEFRTRPRMAITARGSERFSCSGRGSDENQCATTARAGALGNRRQQDRRRGDPPARAVYG